MSCILWPLVRSEFARTADATTYQLRVTIDGVTENLVCPSMTAGRYYWGAGDDQADSDGGVGGVGDFVRRYFRETLETHTQITVGGETVLVQLSSTNRITLTFSVAATIHWAHANTTLSALPFGWTQADTASASVQTSPNQTYGAWCPLMTGSQSQPPSVDSREIEQRQVGAAVALSGAQRLTYLGAKRAHRDLSYRLIAQRYGLAEYVDATEPRGSAQHLWQALSQGRPCRLYLTPASRTPSSYAGPYVARAEELKEDLREVLDRDGEARLLRWKFDLPLRRLAA